MMSALTRRNTPLLPDTFLKREVTTFLTMLFAPFFQAAF
jgi:hypothetical protein